jgi:hypothetical protein
VPQVAWPFFNDAPKDSRIGKGQEVMQVYSAAVSQLLPAIALLNSEIAINKRFIPQKAGQLVILL